MKPTVDEYKMYENRMITIFLFYHYRHVSEHMKQTPKHKLIY